MCFHLMKYAIVPRSGRHRPIELRFTYTNPLDTFIVVGPQLSSFFYSIVLSPSFYQGNIDRMNKAQQNTLKHMHNVRFHVIA